MWLAADMIGELCQTAKYSHIFERFGMYQVSIRLLVVSTVVLAIALGGVASPVAGAETCVDGCLKEPGNDQPELNNPKADAGGPSVDDDHVAATRVRKAFLQAKKAFHEASPNIKAIKKVGESPAEDVPTFFSDDEDVDGDE